MSELKLYMVLLGCKPTGRHVEQHDIFFGIADSLKELVNDMEAFWPEAGKIHIDAWREVTNVDGFKIQVSLKQAAEDFTEQNNKLFFINLGGYQENKFEEQHYFMLTVKQDRAAAFKEAKQTLFFQNNHFEGASSHIDDKYGIDVDELYEIEDILSPSQKEKYKIKLSPSSETEQDPIHLGYLKLSLLK
ncbi:protein of unknown function [Pseudarcicella hirudinis]|uniref:DUF1543 domain-containing protein n=1 Tax=Pseudarcicella hirudinis TaxID=1079859 RepID=A0A1I5UYV6_9BACT|nr:DUF1543 domain-containing protein [Pseudarcicella hirudinis]SFQ00388.1 protein of unknown function [Pseudarcicella hirudinis]